MKPVLMRHVETTNESFKAWKNGNPYLHNPWHYHPELEITVIIKGSGVLFVGDKILKYKENEVFLIGSNLPHEWRSDIKKARDNYSESIAVHFMKDFPGVDFYKIAEAFPIKQLLDQSARGIKVGDLKTMEFIRQKLLQLIETKGIERISILFSILDAIAQSPRLELLSSHSFVISIDEGQNHKIIQVYKFMISNFKNQISLEQVSAQINMSPTSFCRFFKRRTNKSFIQYLNEIRIGYSCKLLIEGNYNVSEVAYESGFENISHFNKQFRKIKRMTPSEFVGLQSREK
jgi:AraC-like DNA-binding protein